MVGGSAQCCLCHQESQSDGSKLAPGLMSGGLNTSAFSLPEPCDVPFDMNKGWSRAPAASTHSTWWEPKESSPVHPQPRKEHLDFTSITTEPHSPSSFIFNHFGKQAPQPRVSQHGQASPLLAFLSHRIICMRTNANCSFHPRVI
jgi:hypothetical protein